MSGGSQSIRLHSNVTHTWCDPGCAIGVPISPVYGNTRGAAVAKVRTDDIAECDKVIGKDFMPKNLRVHHLACISSWRACIDPLRICATGDNRAAEPLFCVGMQEFERVIDGETGAPKFYRCILDAMRTVASSSDRSVVHVSACAFYKRWPYHYKVNKTDNVTKYSAMDGDSYVVAVVYTQVVTSSIRSLPDIKSVRRSSAEHPVRRRTRSRAPRCVSSRASVSIVPPARGQRHAARASSASRSSTAAPRRSVIDSASSARSQPQGVSASASVRASEPSHPRSRKGLGHPA